MHTLSCVGIMLASSRPFHFGVTDLNVLLMRGRAQGSETKHMPCRLPSTHEGGTTMLLISCFAMPCPRRANAQRTLSATILMENFVSCCSVTTSSSPGLFCAQDPLICSNISSRISEGTGDPAYFSSSRDITSERSGADLALVFHHEKNWQTYEAIWLYSSQFPPFRFPCSL
jgi:hypothetical protein